MEKVKTYVLKISDETKEKMVEYFKDKRRPTTPPYAIFQADEEDTVVTLYNSNKVVFQGISADIDANMWNQFEKNLTGKDALQKSKDKKEKKEKYESNLYFISSIGSDEVGTGDYFGPIVVTACYVKKEDISFLEDLKVKDSKKLSDADILNIVPKLIKKIPYTSYILSNTDYNKYYSENMNMNKIKAILHNKVLVDISKKITELPGKTVVDQFVYPKKYFEHIKDAKEKVVNITFVTKAEDKCLSVACASLISRYIFIKEIDKISNDLGITLPKGASNTVDEVGKKIVLKYGSNKLREIAKLNFKNTDKILDK